MDANQPFTYNFLWCLAASKSHGLITIQSSESLIRINESCQENATDRCLTKDADFHWCLLAGRRVQGNTFIDINYKINKSLNIVESVPFITPFRFIRYGIHCRRPLFFIEILLHPAAIWTVEESRKTWRIFCMRAHLSESRYFYAE